jgi:hypothetical protein
LADPFPDPSRSETDQLPRFRHSLSDDASPANSSDKMPAPSLLLALPVEMLTAICADLLTSRTGAASRTIAFPLPAHEATWQSMLPNYAPLKAIAQTCRKLHEVALPLLCQRVSVAASRTAAFINLVGHFSRFPHHRDLVRELVMFDESHSLRELSLPQNSFLFDEARRRGIRVLLTTEVDKIGPVASLLLALLLCQTPNIRTLV